MHDARHSLGFTSDLKYVCAQVLDALLPLYLNGCLLRSLQGSLASELAARMNAMNSASDNAKDLRKVCGCICVRVHVCV